MSLTSRPYESAEPAGVDDLLREQLPLVKQIALRLAVKLPDSIELDDLMQAGLIGLLHARGNYNPDSGASFTTYAGIRIRGAMLDELRSSDWLPRRVQKNLRRVAEAIDSAAAALGRPPSGQEIADQLQMSLQDYHALAGQLACARMVNLGEEAEAYESHENDDPAHGLGAERMRELLAQAITELPEKEGLMMSLYYDEGLNLKEIGLVLGVSESRVSQLHGQALARLKGKLRDWAQ